MPSADFTDPTGENVVPSTWYSLGMPEGSTMRNCDRRQQLQLFAGIESRTLDTLIWLVVNVPVLSEQMTFVQPRVSTLGRFLTIAFF